MLFCASLSPVGTVVLPGQRIIFDIQNKAMKGGYGLWVGQIGFQVVGHWALEQLRRMARRGESAR